MKKKVLISIIAFFSIVFLAKADNVTMWLECEGTGEGVGVNTVDVEYFDDNQDEYEEYLEELTEALCEEEFGSR